MSTPPTFDPADPSAPLAPDILARIDGRIRSLGGLDIRRVLPAIGRKTVGPFVFFDHLGPVAFPPGRGIEVRPHPHINLATVTYLFEGEILHRDSLGSLQTIRPGAINWMTAGRGIVHSERMAEEVVARGSRLHGLQLWVALPKAHEETAPAFSHYPADTLPEVSVGRARLRVLAGTAFGATSPVSTLSSLFCVDAALPVGSRLELPPEHLERAAYVAEGSVGCGTESAHVGRLVVFSSGVPVRLEARRDSRVFLFGGAPLDGERHIFWNFVSSRKERIEQAKQDWQQGRFPKVPGDEEEFIPLPD